jgi:hypothetical protein
MSRINSHDAKAARRRARAARTCPSCGAAGERVLTHAADCALTAASAAVSGESGTDARYFEDNPAARSFTGGSPAPRCTSRPSATRAIPRRRR